LFRSGLEQPLLGIVAARSTEAMSAEQQALVQAMTLQIGTLLDREMLWKLTQEARTNEEIDRLYTALLDLLTHEIRTPIAVIQGTVSSLLGGLIRRPEDSKKLLGEADQALTRLNRLIDNLLDMSRIEAGKLKLNLDWHDPAEILQKVVTQAEREFPESRLRVSGNAAYLLRVDFNLMEKSVLQRYSQCLHSQSARCDYQCLHSGGKKRTADCNPGRRTGHSSGDSTQPL
jgi:two-component system sensor histidine kinase KdpD